MNKIFIVMSLFDLTRDQLKILTDWTDQLTNWLTG